ncbi:hypothetical protein F4553_004338 [Allocatelliglobosispora scoriae]|uniref:Uncharacterized protein n=1 Tax=Allocatelliglobosispora scoriae TaxID=643052 RepID=A0A841BUX1_9ACTN|nr:hypothetical protein [Allocatelliglobosispora scoriae]MBB5870959.1 hypothetical protein [Allocatelliglobosispora scoriae]
MTNPISTSRSGSRSTARSIAASGSARPARIKAASSTNGLEMSAASTPKASAPTGIVHTRLGPSRSRQPTQRIGKAVTEGSGEPHFAQSDRSGSS